jgi:RHS repeat-associated protein
MDRGFTGFQLETESDIYYARSRFYSPKSGEFISRDSFNYQGTFSLYGSPFVALGVDPTGHSPFLVISIALALGVTAEVVEGWFTDDMAAAFDGQDAQGADLYSHWLIGTGVPIVLRNDQFWAPYMKRNTLLRGKSIQILKNIASKYDASLGNEQSISFYTHNSAEIEDGYSTGYQYLHGARDYQVYGTLTKHAASDGTCCDEIEFNVEWRWVDDIDFHGWKDWIAASFIKAATIDMENISPAGYGISLAWTSNPIVYLCPESPAKISVGWPYMGQK